MDTNASFRARLDAKIGAMTPKQKKARIKELKESNNIYMRVDHVMEWICLTQKCKADEAEFLVREYLRQGGAYRFAPDA